MALGHNKYKLAACQHIHLHNYQDTSTHDLHLHSQQADRMGYWSKWIKEGNAARVLWPRMNKRLATFESWIKLHNCIRFYKGFVKQCPIIQFSFTLMLFCWTAYLCGYPSLQKSSYHIGCEWDLPVDPSLWTRAYIRFQVNFMSEKLFY